MGLSRLDNFLKSAKGTILYVNPNDLDATDSIENQGNSLTRPFKTIQRALVEAARFSYQRGLNNDRFAKTTILLYPGDHIVDNRPGWIPVGSGSSRLRNGTTSFNLVPFDLTTNFDLTTADNALYPLNSIHGGVIVPRGTSIVGLDLRKTKIRPKYVPNPENGNIEASSIFRVTGECYFWQFSIFDGDPNGRIYTDYTQNLFVPNFSHHKLRVFEYADGVNGVNIQDEFITYISDRTDLDMYYEKVGIAYGPSSGREILPDYPDSAIDIEPKIDEYRIVGSTGISVGISSIRSGDGITPTSTITVTTTDPVIGLDVDTPFRISGITASGYDGQYVVAEKLSDTQIVYQVQNAPNLALPSVTGSTLTLVSDTVTSASPYIFNCSLRSVYGMCGLLADGAKATGFKSMVVAQFTGIGLQKDDRAFIRYNETTGTYEDSSVPGNQNLSTDSRSVFKPTYRNFHIKATNDAYVQNVSVFAIGFAEHFVSDKGGDSSITNSNSNFGAKALVSTGFRNNAFPQDDYGFISHVIPPKELPTNEVAIEFSSIDVSSTVGIASTGNLYIYNATNQDIPPENVIEGYRFGAKYGDNLNVILSSSGVASRYSSRIVMPGSQSSSEKVSQVTRVGNTNSIVGNVITLTQPHSFANGESVRILSNTGQIPDGLFPNTVYYVITNDNPSSGITTTTEIKLAKTSNDAVAGDELIINAKGGILKVVSRVSDKNSGDIGHPIQYDTTNSQWYVRVSTASTENQIYNTLVSLGTPVLGSATPRTFITRRQDSRSAADKIYRLRYVIPSSAGASARPPSEGYIIQESNTSIGSTTSEIQTYFGSGSLGNINQQRNFRFISNAEWESNQAKISTELPHNLSIGSLVQIQNVGSTINTTGVGETGFNGTYPVIGITSAKQFVVGISTDPGSFLNDTSIRTRSLPYYKRKQFNDIYYVFASEEAQRYIPGQQDGIYYLTVLNSSNKPSIAPFTGESYSQSVKDLYPQLDRDNPSSDPEEANSFANSNLIGQVYTNDVRKSITKETLLKFVRDTDVGVGVTDINSDSTTSHVIHTSVDHGLNRLVNVSIASSGSGYGYGTAGDLYNARLVSIGASVTGKNATAKITINSAGNITGVKIMDGGSSYGIGNTLAVTGTATTTGFSEAVVTVTSVYNNVNDTVKVSGISSDSLTNFNTVYRITDVAVGAANSFSVVSANPLSTGQVTGIGYTATLNSSVYLTGSSIRVSSYSYDHNAGIATVTTVGSHGFNIGNNLVVTGADQSQYNGKFVVDEKYSETTFTLRVGVGTTSPTATGTLYVYRDGIASNDGDITIENEGIGGRMVPIYAGITTTLSAIIPNSTTDEVQLLNISNLDLKIGDYLQIDDEIVRIKTTIPNTPTNPIYIFRGVCGTKARSHEINAVARKIEVQPIELRRHSIIRASGHTFEYLGFGPGNYSTGFPDRQNRQLSVEEELLAQSTKRSGGVNFYTGMNDRGVSYTGNKRVSSISGKEELIDSPIQTITGEDISNTKSINIIDAVEGKFTRSIKVDGGAGSKATSEFNGPVIFNNKVTSTSSKGIEATSLFLQGDAIVSRKYTVGISTPIVSGNPGDVIYIDNPQRGGHIGWVYTTSNEWNRFGSISLSVDSNIGIFDKVGIATTSPGNSTLRVGSGSSLFSVDSNGVGIGTEANSYELHVIGDTNISGTLYAGSLSGDGSLLTNLNATATGWTNVGGNIYNTALTFVGIGTSVPNYTLEVGSVGDGGISLYVNNTAQFANLLDANNARVTGILTAASVNLDGGTVNVGITTTQTLFVGAAGTALAATTSSIGIGTLSPRAKFDIEGHARFKTYSENVEGLSVSSNVVYIDLAKAQTFTLTPTAQINQFVLLNPPNSNDTQSTSFTIKITQGATPYSVNIDAFRNSLGIVVPVYWPSGGVVPTVTQVANRTDIYSFKTFDNGASLFGVVGGQNFA
jgi:hypothetical protein